MTLLRSRASRARVIGAGVAAVGFGLAGIWCGGGAGAATRSGMNGSTARAWDVAHDEDRSVLPVIGNATDLKREPVVHASKGKPPTKVEVKDLVRGTGATVKSSSTVSVFYVGANYTTGKDFTQATWTSKRATTFPLSGVIPGFAEGLIGMKVGGRREIVIPSSLGYGDHSTGPIKANETLVFVVDLKGVSG
ncbi:MAG TPA: FKBP-type peptidyl-prolyl cis-trans isomerase [Acidimicrobiales bacterium]|nr:FKBP-type peptidyl-prolyl cis-trans isomerase [Acidimicrobiales bacterium]